MLCHCNLKIKEAASLAECRRAAAAAQVSYSSSLEPSLDKDSVLVDQTA